MRDGYYSRRYGHYSVEEEWAEGVEAHKRGEDIESNPYDPKSREWEIWRTGWYGIS